jgi:hypothetical protein
MILLDTSIILDYWRDPKGGLAQHFSRDDLCVCGITIAELMHGCREAADINRVEEGLSTFHRIPLAEDVWSKTGQTLFKLRKAGMTVSFQDAVLATLAIAHGVELWASDKHFELMTRVLADLRLFRPRSVG